MVSSRVLGIGCPGASPNTASELENTSIGLVCRARQRSSKASVAARLTDVVVFPDLNAYPKWKEKANELKPITNFKVSNFLEENAQPQEKDYGYDIADYLIS